MPADSDRSRLALANARVGEVLKSKWRLDSLLGVGGMAAVYSATHRNGKRVAIKVLHPEAALVPQVRNRFLREGYLANRVGHPGAVSILDDDVDDKGGAFLVMDLLDGETLEALCGEGGQMLSPADVLVVAHEILDVLAAAHDKEIVHRDLKPANVFVERNGTVRVLDFGIARLLDAESGPGETAGQTIGTPGFMPPEQARGRSQDVGPESDVWAVGATMFYLVTGRPVHAEGTVAEQLVAAITERPPALASIDPSLPPPFCRVVDKALEYERRERYAHARVMRQAVRDAYHELAGTPPMDSARRLMPRTVPLFQTLQTAPTLSAGDTPIRNAPAPASTINSLTPPGAAATTQPSARRRRDRWLVVAGSALAGLGVLAAVLISGLSGRSGPGTGETLQAGRDATAPSSSGVPLAPSAMSVEVGAGPSIVPAASAEVAIVPSTQRTASHPQPRTQLPRASATERDAGSDAGGASRRVDLFNRRK